MGRSPYQSEKRRKELARLKKQEEKRQRRFNKKHDVPGAEGSEGADPQGQPLAKGDTAVDQGPEQPAGEGGPSPSSQENPAPSV